MSIETPGDQFELPLELKLEAEDIEVLKTNINQYLRIEPEIEHTEEVTKVSVSKGGVISVFLIDNFKGSVSLVKEESKDYYASSEDYTDISARPLKSAEEYHEERLQQLENALEETLDPQVIED